MKSNISTEIIYKSYFETHIPTGHYIFKVNIRNTKTMSEICSKLTIKTPERRLIPHSTWCMPAGMFIHVSKDIGKT